MMIERALEKLGIHSMYPWQEAPFAAIQRGEDVFLSAPTGGGKSLMFQLPAVMEEGGALTMVISPLRALQRDQVAQLRQKGVNAVLLNSDLTKVERREILDGLSGTELLYLAPEQLHNKDLREALAHCHVARIAVDEAHVLPQAMLGFRKAYGKISEFLSSLPERPQVIACTATATPKQRKKICQELGMIDAQKFILPVRRNNLHLKVKKIEADWIGSAEVNMLKAVECRLTKWKKHASKKKRGRVIIYAPTVNQVKRIYKWLDARGWKTKKYTGKMSQTKRAETQQAFLSGKVPIVVATNAFGLGINQPDVRLIIHAGLPLGMGGYTQEIGRAGRDGKKSKCVLFYSKSDYSRNKMILSRGASRKAARLGIQDLDALKKLISSKKCLWKGIEQYYGEKPGKRCRKCCRCRS